ncbi:MAG: beta-galactosidase, partial [Acidobacteria bacterium]
MPRWTRRHLLKTALAASAGAATANAALPLSAGGKAPTDSASKPITPSSPGPAGASSSPRERLLLDFGWRFQFGHADDAAKDFGYGATRRGGQFANSGNFLPVTALKFDDSGWHGIDLPHDWAVELPFQETPAVLPH